MLTGFSYIFLISFEETQFAKLTDKQGNLLQWLNLRGEKDLLRALKRLNLKLHQLLSSS